MLDILDRDWDVLQQLSVNPSADDVWHFVSQLEAIRGKLSCKRLRVRICQVEPGENRTERIMAVLQDMPVSEKLSTEAVVIRTILNRKPEAPDFIPRYGLVHLSVGTIPKVQGRGQASQSHGLDLTLPTYISQPAGQTYPIHRPIPALPIEWYTMLRACVIAEICDYRLEQLRQTL